MTDKTKETLKLALEALGMMVTPRSFQAQVRIKEIYDIIHEALAEQASKDKEQAKTDAYIKQLDEALAEQPAQQEPVATVKAKREGGTFVHWTKLPVAGMTLYTSPPTLSLAQRTWVGLTDEERFKVAEQTGCMSADWLDVVKATETALQIKNQ